MSSVITHEKIMRHNISKDEVRHWYRDTENKIDIRLLAASIWLRSQGTVRQACVDEDKNNITERLSSRAQASKFGYYIRTRKEFEKM